MHLYQVIDASFQDGADLLHQKSQAEMMTGP